MTFRDDFLQRGSFPTLNFWLYSNDEERFKKKQKKKKLHSKLAQLLRAFLSWISWELMIWHILQSNLVVTNHRIRYKKAI